MKEKEFKKGISGWGEWKNKDMRRVNRMDGMNGRD